MRHSLQSPFVVLAALGVVLALTAAGVLAENIDPFSDGSKYAWGENVGWINAEPCGNGGPGVTGTTSSQAICGVRTSAGSAWPARTRARAAP